MKLKLTAMEKHWILYDIGNSAFILLVATILPIYFSYLSEQAGISSVNYLAYWGYAVSASTLVVAVTGPILGTISDIQNFKKLLFGIAMGLGVAGCILMGFMHSWLWFLVLFALVKICYSGSLIFYDSMLTDVTSPERMDKVSSHGYAWGYIGSCLPFTAGLLIVLNADTLGLTLPIAMLIAFVITALWWLLFSLPLLRNYRQVHCADTAPNASVISGSFQRLWSTLKEIRGEKAVFFFLLSFFFYIDGVYTIIDMATAYGESLGLDSTGLLLALLLTQVVAFPCALLFGRLSGRYRSSRLITLCIIAYLGISIYAIWLDSQAKFWVLAVCVGMFQGGIQALSRSHFAKIIPPDKSGEYFGILDICGKGASFFGTLLVSVISQLTGRVNLGVGALSIMFLAGLFFFRKSLYLTH